jgi:HPt (histidine-containing phosphotransfer) domain-containing protein
MDVPSIDLDYLERFCKGDKGRMERYIRMYLEASPTLFEQLMDKATQSDAEGLAIAAHSLRPQVNYMGAHRLFDLLTEIESNARQQGTAICGPLVVRSLEMNALVMAELHKAIEVG